MQHETSATFDGRRMRRLPALARWLERIGAWWSRAPEAERAPGERIRSASATGGRAPLVSSAPLRPLALALQGGGAHGAFSWGVLDRLVETPSFRIEAISGASAGALNAAVFAAGYLDGGAEGARQRLEAFWRRVARLGSVQPTALERMMLGWNADWSLSHHLLDRISRLASPYQLNPLGLNPLGDILAELIDFKRLRQDKTLRLFIAATNVETGAGRLFTNEELSPEVLLASASLPTVHQAVKLDDGHYWDGGFSANPPLLPLLEHGEAADILLVRINPASESGVPVTARGIQGRLKRLVFEAPLKRELATLAWLRRSLADAPARDGRLGRRLAALRLHVIGEDEVMRKLGSASKLYPDWRLLSRLKEVGRGAAERWLAGIDGEARGTALASAAAAV